MKAKLKRRGLAVLGGAVMVIGVTAGAAAPASATDKHHDSDWRDRGSSDRCDVTLEQDRGALFVDVECDESDELVRVEADFDRGEDASRIVRLDSDGEARTDFSIPRSARSVDVTVSFLSDDDGDCGDSSRDLDWDRSWYHKSDHKSDKNWDKRNHKSDHKWDKKDTHKSDHKWDKKDTHKSDHRSDKKDSGKPDHKSSDQKWDKKDYGKSDHGSDQKDYGKSDHKWDKKDSGKSDEKSDKKDSHKSSGEDHKGDGKHYSQA